MDDTYLINIRAEFIHGLEVIFEPDLSTVQG